MRVLSFGGKLLDLFHPPHGNPKKLPYCPQIAQIFTDFEENINTLEMDLVLIDVIVDKKH